LSDGPNMIELKKLEKLVEQIDAIRMVVEWYEGVLCI